MICNYCILDKTCNSNPRFKENCCQFQTWLIDLEIVDKIPPPFLTEKKLTKTTTCISHEY